MQVFLTGGTGFIGQPLARALVARGWAVVALVRKADSPQARALAMIGARCVVGDVTDRESLRAGMAGADMVIHNAGWYEMGLPKRAHQLMRAINVVGTDNVLGLALELGVPRAVYISSVAYYGDTGVELRDEGFRRERPPRTYYERSKSEAHDVALGHLRRGLPLITVCPAHVFGPNDHSLFGYFLRMHLSGIMLPLAFSPEMRLSPAHVEDVAEGIALAAERGQAGETYVLSGDTMSLREILATWARSPGGLRVAGFLPRWLMLPLFAAVEPALRMLGLPAFISRETVAGSAGSYAFSSAKARRELGWSYRPAPQMWRDIIEAERRLLAARPRRDIISRLRPVE